MLETIIGICLLIWLIGLLSGGWGIGYLLHVFLVVAVVCLVIKLLTGRNPIP